MNLLALTEASPASTGQILLALAVVLAVAVCISLLLVFCAVLSSKPTRISPPAVPPVMPPALPGPRQPVSSNRKAARRGAQR